MKIALDTNTIISGLFWKGAPRQLLDLARSGTVVLFTTPDMLNELAEVLVREKFSSKLKQANTNVEEIVLGYASLAKTVRTVKISRVIKSDPDDDKVLACAKTAKVDVIVSGDHHLLDLKQYNDIEILTVNQLLDRL